MQESVPRTSAATGKVPSKVAALAAQYRLGALVTVHTGHSPFRIVLFAIGMFAVGAGVAALGGILRFLFVLGLAIIIFGFVAVIFAVKVATMGIVGNYVYRGGFVIRENRKLRAVTWPEVVEFRRVRAGAVMPAHPVPETVIGHKAVLRDGTQLDVGSEKITPQVEPVVTAVGIAVTG